MRTILVPVKDGWFEVSLPYDALVVRLLKDAVPPGSRAYGRRTWWIRERYFDQVATLAADGLGITLVKKVGADG